MQRHAGCWIAVWLATLAACPAPPGSTMPEGEPVHDPLPSTQGDPPSYAPPPSTEATTGAPVGLSSSGGRQAARALALTLLEAVRVGNADELGRLLPGRVARSLPRISRRMNPAQGVVGQILDPRHRQAAGTARPLSALLDLDHVDARPITERLHGRPVPTGLMATDLFVVVPLTPAGRRFFGRLLPGWRLVGGVIVRPGANPQILGL